MMKYLFTIAFSMIFMQLSLAQVNIEKGQRERVLIQTNQQLYQKGDSIWVRCLLIDGVANIPSNSPYYSNHKSNYVYIELYNCQTDTLMYRYKIQSDSLGVFSNAIAIPHDMEEGYYMLVAYTKRMINFEERDFGYKEIYILGNNSNITQTHSSSKTLIVHVYPEGGGLIPQYPQNITYTITDSLQYLRDAEVRLINDEKDSIVAFSHTEFNGMGQIYFSPEEGGHYYLEAYTADGAYGRQDIGELKGKGALLQIKRRKSLISVDVIGHHYDMSKLQLYAYQKGTFFPLDLSDNHIVLHSDSFQEGIVTFVLIDSSNKSILSTRSVYISSSTDESKPEVRL